MQLGSVYKQKCIDIDDAVRDFAIEENSSVAITRLADMGNRVEACIEGLFQYDMADLVDHFRRTLGDAVEMTTITGMPGIHLAIPKSNENENETETETETENEYKRGDRTRNEFARVNQDVLPVSADMTWSDARSFGCTRDVGLQHAVMPRKETHTTPRGCTCTVSMIVGVLTLVVAAMVGLVRWYVATYT